MFNRERESVLGVIASNNRQLRSIFRQITENTGDEMTLTAYAKVIRSAQVFIGESMSITRCLEIYFYSNHARLRAFLNGGKPGEANTVVTGLASATYEVFLESILVSTVTKLGIKARPGKKLSLTEALRETFHRILDINTGKSAISIAQKADDDRQAAAVAQDGH